MYPEVERRVNDAKLTVKMLKALGFKLESVGCNLKIPDLMAVVSMDDIIFAVPCTKKTWRELTAVFSGIEFSKKFSEVSGNPSHYTIEQMMKEISQIPDYEDLAEYIKGFPSKSDALHDYCII